ncbi:MAG: Lrp/AsnC ligand binding domain-containing protein [Thermoleophilia bacterium]|nr:Lrp/AsnC ligand binding domain-containing protein [Thermoleophilia bacterium]
MVRAYVLIKTEPGRVPEILRQVRTLPPVRKADAVTGPADVVVEVEATDPRALAELIFRSVQTISGVKETDTRIVIEE